MKTVIEKKNKEFIRLEQNNNIKKTVEQEDSMKDANREVQMIHMNPSMFGLPMWKFFVVKDKK